MTYGNGATREYGYDVLGNLSAEYYNGETAPRFTRTYDGCGNIVKVTDHLNETTTKYFYDSHARLISGQLKSFSDETLLTASVTCDSDDRASSVSYSFGGRDLAYHVSYGTGNRLQQYSLSGVWTKTPVYDVLNRITQWAVTNGEDTVYTTDYQYLSGNPSVSGSTTGLVSGETNSAGDTLQYAYDGYGKLTTVTRNGQIVARYTYDSAR